jgi:hypothetical protein
MTALSVEMKVQDYVPKYVNNLVKCALHVWRALRKCMVISLSIIELVYLCIKNLKITTQIND